MQFGTTGKLCFSPRQCLQTYSISAPSPTSVHNSGQLDAFWSFWAMREISFSSIKRFVQTYILICIQFKTFSSHTHQPRLGLQLGDPLGGILATLASWQILELTSDISLRTGSWSVSVWKVSSELVKWLALAQPSPLRRCPLKRTTLTALAPVCST